MVIGKLFGHSPKIVSEDMVQLIWKRCEALEQLKLLPPELPVIGLKIAEGMNKKYS